MEETLWSRGQDRKSRSQPAFSPTWPQFQVFEWRSMWSVLISHPDLDALSVALRLSHSWKRSTEHGQTSISSLALPGLPSITASATQCRGRGFTESRHAKYARYWTRKEQRLHFSFKLLLTEGDRFARVKHADITQTAAVISPLQAVPVTP